ncbi:hypothetical protein LTR08_004343 [Meristemomyces frigidus]|nr:hypothetical protein LTR08_004343 [Meristemomyces frigidus]
MVTWGDDAAPATPSRRARDAAPLVQICNRCIPHWVGDQDRVCDGEFGALARKCSRCARARHPCVEVEPTLYPHVNRLVRARAALAVLVDGGEEDEDTLAGPQAEVEEAGGDLVASLATLNRNRSRLLGDRPTPRRVRAAAAPAPSSETATLELQSIRRGLLALVEVGRLFLEDRGVNTASVNDILGVDGHAAAPAPEGEEEESEEEDEEMEG